MEVFDYAEDKDSPSKFLQWIDRHPDGLVINCKGAEFVLHLVVQRDLAQEVSCKRCSVRLRWAQAAA